MQGAAGGFLVYPGGKRKGWRGGGGYRLGRLAALRVPLLLDGWWWFTGGRGAVVSWFTPG